MLSPQKTSWRKQAKGKMGGIARKGCDVSFGEFGLLSMDKGWVTARQIEAGRMAISRHVKRSGKLWIRMFPDKPVSKKPLETRMGKGKGNPEEWVCVVKPGKMLYEIQGVEATMARKALQLAGNKLPVRTKVISREGEI